MGTGLEEQLLIAAIRESSARIPELVQTSGMEAAYGYDAKTNEFSENLFGLTSP